MAVKELDEYVHYSNGSTYRLLSIALPIDCMPKAHHGSSTAFHVELKEDIEIFNVGNTVFTEKNEFLVIYQNVDDAVIYARPVDIFFGKTDANIKRFIPVDDSGDE